MKIVDRATFLSLPPETVFAKYEPQIFGEMRIKGETWGDDFLAQELVEAIACADFGELMDMLDRAPETGESIPLDYECQSRDGMFDADQLFAVWEPQDVAALIARLSRAQASFVESDPAAATR